jgi:hypothetical protein
LLLSKLIFLISAAGDAFDEGTTATPVKAAAFSFPVFATKAVAVSTVKAVACVAKGSAAVKAVDSADVAPAKATADDAVADGDAVAGAKVSAAPYATATAPWSAAAVPSLNIFYRWFQSRDRW